MDIENIQSWVSQPDVCRCCLSASGTLDVTASYLSESGLKEVYFDMLQTCYGISLSCITQWGPSRMVCKLCIGHIREACSFRDQVLQAEKHFIDYWNTKGDLSAEMKTEVESEQTSAEGFASDGGGKSDAERKPDGDVMATVKSERDKHRRKKVDRARRKKKIATEEYDSDVPISAMLDKIEPSSDAVKSDFANEQLNKGIDELAERPVQRKVRQVSERKRLMTTCDTVLRHTTACPFRHHKSWFQCFFCTEEFMQLNLLRDHTNLTHEDVDAELKRIKRYPRSLQIEISNLECRNCHSKMTDVDEMRHHLADAHQKVLYKECIADYKVNGSPYSCHLCKREFHVFRTLTTHLNEHYANCICDVCGKSFLNSKRFKVHKRTHESGSFPCNECGKVLKTKMSKANHMESAHSKRQMKCQICFQPMKHYNDRIKHMSEVHNITHKFKCPICNREYNIKHYLATHIRQTHGHKNKKCQECGAAFITNHGLKKHMLKHTGLKPFVCTVCSKSYVRSYTLREHMRTHETQTERFMCTE